MNLVLVRRRQLSFDHYGILGPGLQWSDQVPRIIRLLAVRGTQRRINISNRPAVRATRVLSIKLCHILVRPGADRKERDQKQTDRHMQMNLETYQWRWQCKAIFISLAHFSTGKFSDLSTGVMCWFLGTCEGSAF